MDVQGHKTQGLARLPTEWTPPYVAIPAELATAIAPADSELNGEQIAARLRASVVSASLTSLFIRSPGGVVIRSSALDEGMSARGLYSSHATTFPSFQTVGEAMKAVWEDAVRINPRTGTIPVLVQTRIDAHLIGHLSNEARLRKDRRDWVVEMRGEFAETHSSGLRALRSDRVPLSAIDFRCFTPDALRRVLRQVAGAFTYPGSRTHFEWLWDGMRLWIVQCDSRPELRSQYPRASGEAVTIPSLSVFRRPQETDRDIPKIRCVAEYVAAGIPYADLWVLRDADLIVALANGHCPPALMADLESLASAGVVIRSDYARGVDDFEVLLPRTETERSASNLRQFLVETARLLLSKGVGSTDIAFLTHVFIPADAAAWSLAAPTSPEVRLDATYGLPDGLLYYPHDSYVVNLRRETVRRRIRAKDSVLLCADDGGWRMSELGAPWDWRSTLTDTEALAIGHMSKRLSDYLGRPVETMFFIRARTADGTIEALPWVHRRHNVGTADIDATESHFPSRAVEVRNRGDLAVLREVLEVLSPGERLLVRLKPEGEVLHDGAFLDSIIAELRPECCTIDLAGSTLSHAFYELQRAGLQVRASDPLGPSEAESVPFNKLVRDSIPDMIAAKGERVSAYTAESDERSGLLRRKLIEEALEVAGTVNTNELMEEVGDVIDVLEALCALSGTNLDAVRTWAERKRKVRGGFQGGVVLLETRDRSLEEALRGDDLGVVANLGVTVERMRHSRAHGQRIVVNGEVELPFSVLSLPGDDPLRLVIGDQELHVQLRAGGLSITRVDIPGGDPNQLYLDV